MNLRRLRSAFSMLLLAAAVLPVGCGEGVLESIAPPGPVSTQVYGLDGTPRAPLAARAGRPNVVLLVLEGLRADAFSLGAEGGTPMPQLASLARRGMTFTNASSASASGTPALASLLTGLLPSGHGISPDDEQARGLHPLATWAEILARAAGYETAAWVGSPVAAGDGTALEGFARVEPGFRLRTAPQAIERWAATRNAQRPCFLLVEATEAKAPYGRRGVERDQARTVDPASPDPVAALGADAPLAEVVRRGLLDPAFHTALFHDARHTGLRQRLLRYAWSGLKAEPNPALTAELHGAYLEGVRAIDERLEGLLGALEKAHVLDDALLVVTSTHGLAFGEHALLREGRALYDEQVRVPLVVVGPKGSPFTGGRVIEGSVGLVDLVPTCLELVGLPVPDGIEGTSLLPIAHGTATGHPVLAEEVRTLSRTGGESEASLVSVRDEAWKIVVTYERTKGTVVEEAYDLTADPGERTNLAEKEGLVRGLPFSRTFCDAVERARNHVWGRVQGTRFLVEQGYAAVPYVLSDRPTPACDVPAAPER